MGREQGAEVAGKVEDDATTCFGAAEQRGQTQGWGGCMYQRREGFKEKRNGATGAGIERWGVGSDQV